MSDGKTIGPLAVSGVSMAPWLMPGDAVLVDASIDVENVAVGDVLVFRHSESKAAIIHRLIGKNPLRVKGDRNQTCDELTSEWLYEGSVRKFFRDGKWRELKRGRFLAWISSAGLYPGQRIPSWMSRSNLCRGLFR